jgi:Kef-type K+ transport system membrane component KefB
MKQNPGPHRTLLSPTAPAMQLLVLACAASAGVHAALAPEHWRESATAGAGFAVSAVALAVCAVLLDRRPESQLPVGAATVLLAALIGVYVVTRLTVLPPLAAHQEPVDALGLATKLVEAAGLACALVIGQRLARGPQGRLATQKGVRT